MPELNDQYVAAMEDVLETYEKPHDSHEPVVCLDEKPITLHADTRPSTPVQPGKERRRDYEYQRCGTAHAFCAVEPKDGRHFVFITPDRTAAQFAQVLFHLAMAYPDAKTIHLVLDNLNIHCRKSLIDFYGEETGGQIWDRFTIHHTPKHASWLNQAEIQISLFSPAVSGKPPHRRLAYPPARGRRLDPPCQSQAHHHPMDLRSQNCS